MAADLDKARTRSVDNLQRLYAFVVSLAFAESLRRVLLSGNNNVDLSLLSWDKCRMCLGLIVTAIPFFHGSNRYLDATYVTGERSATKQWALMIDFLFLFVQALLMVAVALLITTGNAPVADTNHKLFYGGLALLLIIDVIWIGISRCTTSEDPNKPLQFRRWAGMNIVAVIGIGFLVYFAHWNLLLVWLFARTVLDYQIVRNFYYPPM